MSSTFTVFVPAMLPTARAPFPSSAASIPVASSGALVPTATIVRPMMIGGIPSRLANSAPPRVTSSAPMIRKSSPAAHCPMARIIPESKNGMSAA